ncbi:MAG: glutamate--tRNA ligase [Acidimicrobiales bacterium]|jgi:glutamyl-tRNA synthetase
MTSEPAVAETSRAVRVRIAPSPTGYFHVGGARTALYNWCFARRHHGAFILRIEDTDSERNKEEWVDGIGSALAWLGIDWDEGPYRQSLRKEHYQAALDALWSTGHLYACDCTREMVLERTKQNATPGYDGFCRDRGLERQIGRALRFRVPREGVTLVDDLIRGEVRFANVTIEDFVVAKSNGDPLFVLAGVVDDREMRISHVIRAEEHLPTTPKAVLLWEALGTAELPLPSYAHLPVLVNEKRQKISKRRDRVAIEDYRAQGFLPEAMVNYLALLGWSPGDGRELFSLDELVSGFDLGNVNHSPAFFDQQKLLHFNGVYLRALPVGEFVDRCRRWAEADAVVEVAADFASPQFARLAPLVQERAGTLSEAAALVEFLFCSEFVIEDDSFQKAIARDPDAGSILVEARERLQGCAFDAESLRSEISELGDKRGRKLGKVQAPIRVAALGSSVGLPLFESLEVLGRGRTLERLDSAIARLGTSPRPSSGG